MSKSGGVVVVSIGVVAVTALAIAAMSALPDNHDGTLLVTLVTGLAGVIGTLVGAFFGLSITAQGRDDAETARNAAEQQKDVLAGALTGIARVSTEISQQGQIVRAAQDRLGINLVPGP